MDRANDLGTKRVALFATCVSDVLYPETPLSAARVLERLGVRVEFPREQTCCGQIMTNTGYYKEAVSSVRTFVQAFEGYDYVVAPSGSCVAAVREQHTVLARYSEDEGLMASVDAVVPKVYELSEFLIDILGVEDVGATFDHTVTFHRTCHAVRNAHLGDRPLRLLSKVRGLKLIDLAHWDVCCGFGGTFSLKNPEISASMAREKAAEVEATGAEYLVSVDNACLLNISGILSRQGSGVRPIHLADILAGDKTDRDSKASEGAGGGKQSIRAPRETRASRKTQASQTSQPPQMPRTSQPPEAPRPRKASQAPRPSQRGEVPS